MSQSQVVSFRASGHFLNWIEAQRLDGESVSQAAQRILKELSVMSTAVSTMSTSSDTNVVSTMSTDLSTQNNNNAMSTGLSTVAPETVDTQIAAKLDPVIERLSKLEERLGKLGLSDGGGDESLKQELEEARGDYAKLLESSTHVTNKLGHEVQQLRSQLETERADREEIEAELSELKQNSALAAIPSEKLTPDAATILSQLRARRKKSKTDLADLEAILEILES
jgi:predicted RNase H-like nuclease (RuvC/YqgF family)